MYNDGKAMKDNPKPKSTIRDWYTRRSPLSCIQITNELSYVCAVRLIEGKQRIPPRGIRKRCHRQMRASQTFFAVDDKFLVVCDGSVLGGPRDVKATYAQVGILDVEIVRETH